VATSSPHRSPAVLPRLVLALLCATVPGAARAQQDTLVIPAQPVSAAIVPDLSGRTVEEARTLLAEQGLEVGALDEVVASGLPGTVARQQPGPGVRVRPGSAIPLWLVAARVTVMPAVMGLPPERALRLIRQAGLRQGETSGWNTPGAIRVIGHTYRAGERVPANAVVNLSFGIPPATRVAVRADPPRAVVARVDSGAVPDVRTLDLAAARTALEGAGLAAAFDSAFADSAGWTVATQAPEAGARVPVGSPVQLAFAAPAPPPAAPVAAGPVVTALQPAPATPPPPPVADGGRGRAKLWIALVVVLIAAAGAGAMRMRAGKAAPPVTGVRVALRTDVQPRSSIAGPPLGLPRLKLLVRPGLPASRIATAGPLFRAKGGAG
jgi:beta-lactam-binding protein with PASTA domain